MSDKLDRIYNIIQEICDYYTNRLMTQEDLAVFLNEKYNTAFTSDDVREITSQLGYWHTIKRGGLETVIFRLSQSWREHAE